MNRCGRCAERLGGGLATRERGGSTSGGIRAVAGGRQVPESLAGVTGIRCLRPPAG
jgi:hypothetical protein